MKRICFVLNVRPECIEEYKMRHSEVWPEMREALRKTGWHDYSLFLRRDGLLVGYLLTDDFERAKTGMKCLEVNARWQAQMAPFFEGLQSHPDEDMHPLEEVFRLDG